jgi:DNA-binding NarL/FixJ family response regulator
MVSYLLLRNNKQSGPFSFEEIAGLGIMSNDLIWVEGKSSAWRFPEEIDELKKLLQPSTTQTRTAISRNKEPRPSDYSGLNPLGGPVPEDQPGKKQESPDPGISSRSIELRKINFLRKETERKASRPAENESVGLKIDVIIADDHGLFREGVKTALSRKTDISIVGEAENGQQLLNLLKHSRPDVVLLDIQMPVMDGISALQSIRKYYPELKVIILSMHEGHSMVSALMESGANGYLTKTAEPETIYQAVKTFYEKNYFFNELTNLSMLEGLRSKKKIPEKIKEIPFNGGDLMEKWTLAKSKPDRSSGKGSAKRVLITALSLILLGAAAIAGISLIVRTDFSFLAPPKNSASLNQPASIHITPSGQASLVVSDSNTTHLQKASAAQSTESVADPQEAVSRKPSLNLKKINKKDRDGSHATLMPALLKTDTTQIAHNPPPAKETEVDPALNNAVERARIYQQVAASVNDYHKGAFGGLSDIEITVNNHSGHPLDEVVVELKYILSNSKIYKTETLHFQNLSAGSTSVQPAPKSSRGTQLQYHIISIRSKDLGL